MVMLQWIKLYIKSKLNQIFELDREETPKEKEADFKSLLTM